MSALHDRVAKMLVDEFGVDADAISPTATLEELDLDSLDLVEFGQLVEDEMGVVISDEEAESLKTVGDTVTLLESKGAEA